MYNFQSSLLYDYQAILEASGFYRKYQALFSALDLSGMSDRTPQGPGRKPYSRHSMIRAFIVKHLEEIKSVPKLITFLDAHPMLTEMCGFTMGCLPDNSQFYRFLGDINGSEIENIHHKINKELIQDGVISLDQFAMDSKPVMAATKHNNFKNPRRSKDKNKNIKRNPQATLGYYSYISKPDGSKDYEFFWGYRTHVIVCKEGIPLVTATLPNSFTDAQVAMRMIRKLKRVYKFKKGAIFIADSAYDERNIYNLIAEDMKSKPYIPLNPRNTQEPKTFGPSGAPLCDGGLEMYHSGSWTEGQRKRVKFRCPLKASKKIAAQHPEGCPADKECFSKGKAYGCTKYLDVTDDARKQVPRSSQHYKKTYKQRIVVEQYFSRLGDREVEQTTHYKLRPVQAQIGIAHLSASLVALAAVRLGQKDKIRCYRTFALAA